MAAAVSIARWKFSEASSGTTPTTVADDTGNGNTLSLDYSSGDMAWSSIAAGNGLNITAAANTPVGPRTYLADAVAVGNISSQLSGDLEAGLILVLDVNTPAASVTLFRIANQNSGSASFAVLMDNTRRITVVWGDEYDVYRTATFDPIGTGVRALAIRIDTAQAAVNDRAKLADNAANLTIQSGDIDITQNLAFGVTGGYPVGVDIFNRKAGDNNPQGKIYYAELFTGYLTDTQVTNSSTNLSANNDADWNVTPIELAGDAADTATATGDLSTGIVAAGDAAGVATATGDLTTGIQLAGDAVAVAAATGDMSTGTNLAGNATAEAAASAALTTAINLAGDAASVVAATGDLATAVALTGAAESVAQASGDLLTAVQLAAAASALSTAAGGLVTWAPVTVASPVTGPGSIFDSRYWSGTAAANGDFIAYEDRDGFEVLPSGEYSAPGYGSWMVQFAYAATPNVWYLTTVDIVQTDFAGDAFAQVGAAGALLTAIQMAANAAAEATATAALTVSTDLAGDAQALATAAADLTTAIQLAGDATAEAAATGALNATAAALEAAAASVATAQGSLTTGIPLAGDAAVLTSVTGVLDTAINLIGAAAALSTATGDLVSGVAELAGAAQSLATATAQITTAIQLVAAAEASSTATGTVNTQINLEGNATVVAEAIGRLFKSPYSAGGVGGVQPLYLGLRIGV